MGFLATMVLLLCGRQHQPLPIGPGRAVEVIVHFDAQLIQDGASTLFAEAQHPFPCHLRRTGSPLEQRNLLFGPVKVKENYLLVAGKKVFP